MLLLCQLSYGVLAEVLLFYVSKLLFYAVPLCCSPHAADCIDSIITN